MRVEVFEGPATRLQRHKRAARELAELVQKRDAGGDDEFGHHVSSAAARRNNARTRDLLAPGFRYSYKCTFDGSFPHWLSLVRFRMLHPVEVPHEADHAVVTGRCRLEVEAGFTNQREVAAEGAQRHAEAALVVRDGHRFAASKNRREPDDANEREGNAAAVRVAKLYAAARRGFRRERVESGGANAFWLIAACVVPSFCEIVVFVAERCDDGTPSGGRAVHVSPTRQSDGHRVR